MTAYHCPPLPVLIVDSDPENRDFLKLEFTKRGYTVLEADDCVEAFQRLENQRVCAVIFDVELSRKERSHVITALQAERYGSPVVFMLVAASTMTREEGYGLGAAAVLSKPIDPSALINRLSEQLIPAPTRWKRRNNPAAQKAHVVSVSLPKLELGKGGFSMSRAGNKDMLEGDRVEFALEVKDQTIGTLRGTGIVRYVSLDASRRLQKAWGIEFESLDDESLNGVMRGIETDKPLSFIPSYISRTLQ